MSGVLVVGAAGLIGRAVLAEAGRSGQPHAIVSRPSARAADAHVLRLTDGTVGALGRLLARIQPDAIVNATGRAAGDPETLRQAHVEPLRALIAAMRLAAPNARLVHVGSAAEYADHAQPKTDEEAPLDASTPYAAAKIAALRHVADAAGSGLDTVVARVFNPIGSDMPETSLPGRAARLIATAVREGAGSIELGSLDAVRDYVDLRDIATAVLLLASTPHLEHRAYNVGTGRPTAVRELVAMIAERAGFSGEIGETEAGSPRSARVGRRVADIGRIRTAGWEPRVTLHESVDALVAGTVAGGASSR